MLNGLFWYTMPLLNYIIPVSGDRTKGAAMTVTVKLQDVIQIVPDVGTD